MKLVYTSLLAAVLFAPAAYASPLNAQSQGQAQGQVAKGGHAQSTAQSVSQSSASARNKALSSSGGNSSDQSVGGDDNSSDVNAWGFAYVDSAPQVPQAVATSDVVVTSQNLKVLGPVFGYAWQDLELAPMGLFEMVDLVQIASTNDTTDAGRSQQSSALAVICTYKPELADARFGEKACDRIGSIVESTK